MFLSKPTSRQTSKSTTVSRSSISKFLYVKQLQRGREDELNKAFAIKYWKDSANVRSVKPEAHLYMIILIGFLF